MTQCQSCQVSYYAASQWPVAKNQPFDFCGFNNISQPLKSVHSHRTTCIQSNGDFFLFYFIFSQECSRRPSLHAHLLDLGVRVITLLDQFFFCCTVTTNCNQCFFCLILYLVILVYLL